MGCSDCSTSGGCDSRKGTQREVLDAIFARIYPTRVWGEPDDEARFRAGVPRAEVKRLARSIASVAQAPVFFRPGADEDLCDFVWVLCVGRRPAIVEIRDGQALAAEMVPGAVVEERYLRVAVSTVGRLAAMQEVTLSLAAHEDGSLDVRESSRPGVFDPILLKRVRKIVALLEASDVSHIDFGLLDVPADAAAGRYEDRFGVAPRLANYFFQAAPPNTTIVTHIPA